MVIPYVHSGESERVAERLPQVLAGMGFHPLQSWYSNDDRSVLLRAVTVQGSIELSCAGDLRARGVYLSRLEAQVRELLR